MAAEKIVNTYRVSDSTSFTSTSDEDNNQNGGDRSTPSGGGIFSQAIHTVVTLAVMGPSTESERAREHFSSLCDF